MESFGSYTFYSFNIYPPLSTVEKNEQALIETREATVGWMEGIGKAPLQVKIEKQEICDSQLIRHATLFFHSSKAVVLYRKCILYIPVLDKMAYEKILAGQIPIETVFTVLGKNLFMRKESVTTKRIISSGIATKLRVNDFLMYKKNYLL